MPQRTASRTQKRPPLVTQDSGEIQGIPLRVWTHLPTLRQMRSKAYMGLFKVGCKVENPTNPGKSAVVRKLMVDTGSEFTWIDQEILREIGIEPQKSVYLQMANGQTLTRSVGFAILRVQKSFTVDEVVFAEKGDFQLLGTRALEGLNLLVDPRRKKLVPGGPQIAAASR